MRWVQTHSDRVLTEEELTALAQATHMPLACARVLAARGVQTKEAVEELLNTDVSLIPNPFLLKGMEEASSRIAKAIVQGQKVAIFGDYDVDGVTSTATLALFLQACGGEVQAFLPRRMVEGYGIPLNVVEDIARQGFSLLITVDCGVTAVEEITLAKELGLDTVVIDHHPPRIPLVLPPAVAIVDPHVPDTCCAFDGSSLCAAGLAFMTCMALRKHLRDMGFYASGRVEPRLREFMDLTALGTIADVVPLTGINRILVRNGMDVIQQASRLGICALKKAAGLSPRSPLSAGMVSYRLAPKINAAGRLNEATPAFHLLTTCDPARAQELATQLEALNVERQAIEQKIYEEAALQAEVQASENRRTIVVAGQGWHRGVVGIVASRLVEQFHRPAIVLALEGETGTGSGRSPEGGIHLAEALAQCSDHLTRNGGHQRAAGLSLNVQELENFRQAFEEVARQATEKGLTSDKDELICHVDTEISLEEITEELAEAIKQLEPFGMGNPEPTFVLKNIKASCRVIQAKRGGCGHLKIFIPGHRHLDIIGFNMGFHAPLVAQEPVDLAFHLTLESFQRQAKLCLRLMDVRRGTSKETVSQV